MRHRIGLGCLVLVLSLLTPAFALAQGQAGESSAREPRAPRPKVLALEVSAGNAVVINSSAEIDPRSIMLRYTWRARPGKRFLGGEPAWGLEVGAMRFKQRPAALGPAFRLVYEHRFLPEASVRPVWSLGAGMVYTGDRVPAGETHQNFTLFSGLGLELELDARTWLQVGYRFHHVSNADTGDRNPGINAHTLAVGIAHAF